MKTIWRKKGRAVSLELDREGNVNFRLYVLSGGAYTGMLLAPEDIQALYEATQKENNDD